MFAGWYAARLKELQMVDAGQRKAALMRQFVGGLLEMTNDSRLFYKSNVGTEHIYSEWTTLGRELLMEYVEDYSRKLLAAEDQDLNERARQLTFDTLKSEADDKNRVL